MSNLGPLIPELARWNNGAGISPDAWIFVEGRADHALGYCAFLWPEFVEFEGYVLRAPLDIARLRAWERSGGWEGADKLTRQQVETAMNAYMLDGAFPQDRADEDLMEAQCERLAEIMNDMLTAKLGQEFPQRRFSAFVINDGDDFGVSFHQL